MNKLLLETMSVQSYTYETKKMQKFILNQLQKMKLKHTKDKYGNIYVTKGTADLYPTMVCHIDTVHEVNNDVQVVVLNDSAIAVDTKTKRQYGIGGDDKVGIYITLEMLKMFDNFKAVFFLDEEAGCVGSRQADFSFFNDSTIVLECDRRGISDFVVDISGTKLSNEEFIGDISDILKANGRQTVSGGLTDVAEISERNPVQVANMSCGYYRPHTSEEYIVLSEVEATKNMCFEILDRTKHKRYEMPLDNRTLSISNYRSRYNAKDEWGWDFDLDYDEQNMWEDYSHCPECQGTDTSFDPYQSQLYCFECDTYTGEPINQKSEEDAI